MNDFLRDFDKRFGELHINSCEIIDKTPCEKLYWKPFENNSVYSCGEYILRSAAQVEQNFGGIMTRLWDDPFEWTLAEELSSNEKIVNYLNEVEDTRKKGFKYFESDKDLQKEIQTPNGQVKLFELLLETLVKAENLRGRAVIVLQICLEN